MGARKRERERKNKRREEREEEKGVNQRGSREGGALVNSGCVQFQANMEIWFRRTSYVDVPRNIAGKHDT